MARIRCIKPEFWTAEQVMECSPMARLLFVGMWNFCDDGGNHPAAFKTLKAEVFPGDDITTAEIQGLVGELIANDLVVEYEANGKRYLHVTGWHHQKIERPNYKHPKPRPDDIRRAVADHSETDRDALADHSPTDRRSIGDHSTPEGKGKEGKGEERSRPAAAAELPRVHASSADAAAASRPVDSAPGDEPPPTADPTTARAIELTAMLRKRGAGLQASNPIVRRWAESGVSDGQALSALETAEQRRQDKGSAQPINAGLIDAILSDGNRARAGPAHRPRQSQEDKNRMALAGWRPKELREATG